MIFPSESSILLEESIKTVTIHSQGNHDFQLIEYNHKYDSKYKKDQWEKRNYQIKPREKDYPKEVLPCPICDHRHMFILSYDQE